ncbi:hypothetical protein ACGIJG_13395 [Lacticaseibacillus rhamnosus]|uniref:hypothetical protein n=1 Tax=Lacticaseibacillus rhamnosus TaxID=47715 RepID=UPI0022E2D54C|nr:hypothetical protein [Lacticaseibacillus rhamnosus]
MSDLPVTPQVMASFNRYWPGFEKSEWYQGLKLSLKAKDRVPSVVQTFLTAMDEITELNPAYWKMGAIRKYVASVTRGGSDNAEEMVTLASDLMVIMAFLEWLAETGVLQLKKMDIGQTMLPIINDLAERVDGALGVKQLEELDSNLQGTGTAVGELLTKPAKPKGRAISLADYKRKKRKNKKCHKKY